MAWRADFSAQLFHRRLATIDRHAHLKHHKPLYKALGPKGMSSDEAITDIGAPEGNGNRKRTKKFRVLLKPWRSPRIIALNQELDRLAQDYILATFTRGSVPHARIRTAKVSDNPFVKTHLPINAYDGHWLASRGQTYVDSLQCNPTPHNF